MGVLLIALPRAVPKGAGLGRAQSGVASIGSPVVKHAGAGAARRAIIQVGVFVRGAVKGRDVRLAHVLIHAAVFVDVDEAFVGFVEVVLIEQILLLDERQDQNRPARAAARVAALALRNAAGRQRFLGGLIGDNADGELSKLALALAPSGRLARRLHRREEQRHQHANDGDHDQQLDEGEAASAAISVKSATGTPSGGLPGEAVLHRCASARELDKDEVRWGDSDSVDT